jgi:arabinofuranosyltransferase
MPSRDGARDLAILGLLLAATAFYAARAVDFTIGPYEDAAMLMRYAVHLGQGHGIVWNVGQAPVDGATDFLFLVSAAGLVRLGLAVEVAVRLLALVAHLLTVGLVYIGARRLAGAPAWAAALSAAYLAVGPGLRYAAAYFGTPFFALFSCLTWLAAMALAGGGVTRGRAAAFAFSALALGLTRPEGVILAALMLASVVVLSGPRASRTAVFWFAGVFGLLGGAYFLWRWRYFGHPLPNPFYKKGGGRLYPTSARESVQFVVSQGLPFLAPVLAALPFERTRRRAVALLVPVGGFALAFLLVSNAMNFGGRFQYALLPVLLLSWWPLAAGVAEEFRLPRWAELSGEGRRAAVLLGLFGAAASVWYAHARSRGITYHEDGRYSVALSLRSFAGRGYTLATSEAGLLPLYSEWKAIDTWGLNDPWITHHGGVTDEYLDRSRPEIVMFNGPWPGKPPAGAWEEMAARLHAYAKARGYVLAAAFGEEIGGWANFYYVRRDAEAGAEIVRRIRAADYRLWVDGRRLRNLAPAP